MNHRRHVRNDNLSIDRFRIIFSKMASLLPGNNKENKESWDSSRREREKKTRDREIGVIAGAYTRVCVLYGTWRAISLAQRRGFFFLSRRAPCDFRREKENVTGTHAPRIDAPSCPWKVSRSREASFTVSGTWSRLVRHGNRSRNRPPSLRYSSSRF